VKFAKAAEKSLQDGTCADQGFTVQTGQTTKSYPIIGDIVITEYAKGLTAQDTCSLFAIDGDTCGQSDLNCNYVKFAKAAEKSLQDGTCADQGYSVQTGQETKSYPIIGDIVITKYAKGLVSQDTCSLFAIDGDTCGQSDLNCDYVKFAKAAEKSLQDGTCADQGYTVQTGQTTKSYPIIGDIVITEYAKGLTAQDTCSLFAIDGDTCGQSDLNCDYVKFAKAAEKSLQDGTCADQGYTVQTGQETKSYPIIGDIVITKYAKGLATQDTCSLFAIDGDTCGQSDLNCDYVKFAKAAEKSLQDGTCADQGFTVQTGQTTKSYPIIGDIVITEYAKGQAMLI